MSLGWVVEDRKDNAHVIFKSPDGKVLITVGRHTYDITSSRWQKIRTDFTRHNKDLMFVWVNPFEIPKNFNMETQTIDQEEVIDNSTSLVKDIQLVQFPIELIDALVIRFNNRWKRPVDIDFNNRVIMFHDGDMLELESPESVISIKPAQTKKYMEEQKKGIF